MGFQLTLMYSLTQSTMIIKPLKFEKVEMCENDTKKMKIAFTKKQTAH
jgi:hypothetical protein